MPWINEFHYDDAGTDEGEFVEIAGEAGLNLAGYAIYLYNGANGTFYSSAPLTGTIPDVRNGFGFVTVPYPANGIQNGSPDAIALVGPGGVVEFISYEGAFVATDGPAAGMTSIDVGAAAFEPGTADGTSIGRIGTGTQASDFSFAVISDDTPGGVNVGQNFPAAGPRVSIGDVQLAETSAGTVFATLFVTRTGGTGAFSVDYATSNGTATAGVDYAATSGTLNFAEGQELGQIQLHLTGDTIIEPNETFFVNLSAPTGGATIVAPQSVVTIVDDDAPSVSIADATTIEGNSGLTSLLFTVTRTSGMGAFTVQFDTPGTGTAQPDSATDASQADYLAQSGTISFAEGQTTRTLSIGVRGDTDPEADETFGVRLTAPTAGAVIADGEAIGRILNDDPIFIHDVQGSAYFSPILAAEGVSAFNVASTRTVTVRAQISAIDQSGNRQGFYLQEETADWDANPGTSEGIFVMTRNDAGAGTPLANIQADIILGNTITLTAQVMEYQFGANQSRTVLVNPTVLSSIITGNSVASLALDASRPIPNSILTNVTPVYTDSVDDPGDTFDLANYALSYFESVEGMLVSVPDMVVADGFVSLAGGRPFLNAYSTVHADADQINSRGGYTIAGDPPLSPPDPPETDDAVTRGGRHLHDGDVNPDIFEVDFTDFASAPPSNLITQATMGDKLGEVTGIIDFDFTDLKLFVINTANPPPLVTNVDLPRETTALGSDARSLTVGTFNVENLDPGDGAARFQAIAQAIATNLKAPDILSIEEIQDNNGAATGGVTVNGVALGATDASLTWQMLVDAVNAAVPGARYQWVDQAPVSNAEGGEQSGNIRVGFLYNTARVQLGDLPADATIEQRRAFTDRIGDGVRDAGDRILYSDDMLGAEINTADWNNTRKSLLAQFTFAGAPVFVTANHLPSKGGSGEFWALNQNLDAGFPANAGWAQRNAIGQDIYSMLNLVQTASPGAGVVSGGDYNDFYFYRPLEAATGYVFADGTARNDGAKLQNLTLTLSEAERYTYTFDGRSQAIDHILTNQVLGAVASYDVVHINTGYNDRGTGADASPALSDHDPALASFDFRSLAERLVGTGGSERIDGFGGNDVIFGDAGNDTLLGGAGDDGIDAGIGEDVVDGGDGADRIYGNAGADLLFGAAGDDLLVGNTGNDGIDGGLGNDTIDGGDDADTLYGNDGDDLLFGSGGNDLLVGNIGNDAMDGGAGEDLLDGGAGDDRLYGNDGSDLLFGGDGADLLFGNTGNDGLDGGAGDDRIDGGEDSDLIYGNDGNDLLFGGTGNDDIHGNVGNDTLDGGDGSDRLIGGGGADIFLLFRAQGSDIIADYENGIDTLFLTSGTTLAGRVNGDFDGDGRLDARFLFQGGGDVTLLGAGGLALIQFASAPEAPGLIA